MKWIEVKDRDEDNALIRSSDGYLNVSTRNCKRDGCLTFAAGDFLIVDSIADELYFYGIRAHLTGRSQLIPKESAVPVFASIYEHERIPPSVSLERVTRVDANGNQVTQVVELERSYDSN